MLYSSIFILSFVCLFVVTIIKFYNILSHQNADQRLIRKKLRDSGAEVSLFPYDLRLTWVLFFIFCVCWGLNFIIFMLDSTEKLFMIGFSISNFFFLLLSIFTIIEIIYKVEEDAQGQIKAMGAK